MFDVAGVGTPSRHVLGDTAGGTLLVACGLLWGKAPTMPCNDPSDRPGILGTQMCYDEFHVGGSRHFRQISVSIVRHRLFYPIMLVCILVLFGSRSQTVGSNEGSGVAGRGEAP